MEHANHRMLGFLPLLKPLGDPDYSILLRKMQTAKLISRGGIDAKFFQLRPVWWLDIPLQLLPWH